MFREVKISGTKQFTVWSIVLIILVSGLQIDASKASNSRRGGHKTKPQPNADHVRLSYGNNAAAPSRTNTHTQHQTHANPPYPQQQHVQQSHVQQQAHAPVHSNPPYPVQRQPSAPELPTNANKPIGWNVGGGDAHQKQTVSNTNTAFQHPQGNPPPYSAYPQNHGAPPPYAANPGLNSHVPAGPPPPYAGVQSYPGQSAGVHNSPPVGYPAGGVHAGGYPQQSQVPYNNNPSNVPSYPVQQQQQPSYYPAGGAGQAPVVNNYYPQQQQKSGGSGLQTALIAGVGGLALYGALKPSEEKTIIIHEGANQAPPVAGVAATPVAPAVAAPDTAAPTPVAPISPVAGNSPVAPVVPQPNLAGSDPQAPLAPLTPLAPLEPIPAVPNAYPPVQPTNIDLNNTTVVAVSPSSNDAVTGTPLAPFPETSSSAPLAAFAETSAQALNAEATAAAPLAPLPVVQSTSPPLINNYQPVNNTITTLPPNNGDHHKGSASSINIVNISVYTILTFVLVKLV